MIYLAFGLSIGVISGIIAIASFIAGICAEKHLNVYDKAEQVAEAYAPMTRREFERDYTV
jgi:hypothetical protein